MKRTLSLCPVCTALVPAIISEINEQMVMHKHCPEHGAFSGIVETSPLWYAACQQFDNPHVYDGCMIDVTSACNLHCRYCYHDNHGQHTPLEQLLEQMTVAADCGPVILTGGEPTLHPDILLILEMAAVTGPFWLLTNGVRLADDPNLFDAARPFLERDGVLQVGLSFHPEADEADFRLLEKCRSNKLHIGTAFYVIDDLQQVDNGLAIFDEYSDVIGSFRIKAASNLGEETNAPRKIFTSELVNAVAAYGGVIDRRYSNKVSYASMLLADREIKCISWYDRSNVDLLDISGPPYYRAKDGKLYNLVTTCLLDGKQP